MQLRLRKEAINEIRTSFVTRSRKSMKERIKTKKEGKRKTKEVSYLRTLRELKSAGRMRLLQCWRRLCCWPTRNLHHPASASSSQHGQPASARSSYQPLPLWYRPWFAGEKKTNRRIREKEGRKKVKIVRKKSKESWKKKEQLIINWKILQVKD